MVLIRIHPILLGFHGFGVFFALYCTRLTFASCSLLLPFVMLYMDMLDLMIDDLT